MYNLAKAYLGAKGMLQSPKRGGVQGVHKELRASCRYMSDKRSQIRIFGFLSREEIRVPL